MTLGVTNPRYVEIRSGVQAGDQVIYAGLESLKEGDPVVPAKWGPSGPLSLPPATGEVAPGTVYTCPIHPEVRSDKPGDCPQCGMRLQPVSPTAGAPAKKSAPVAPAATGGYTCPMHPEVRSEKPGKCPKCGMDLVPATQAASATPARPAASAQNGGYTCPMHPEVHSDKPGKCPKCGMDLEPVTKSGGSQ